MRHQRDNSYCMQGVMSPFYNQCLRWLLLQFARLPYFAWASSSPSSSPHRPLSPWQLSIFTRELCPWTHFSQQRSQCWLDVPFRRRWSCQPVRGPMVGWHNIMFRDTVTVHAWNPGSNGWAPSNSSCVSRTRVTGETVSIPLQYVIASYFMPPLRNTLLNVQT